MTLLFLSSSRHLCNFQSPLYYRIHLLRFVLSINKSTTLSVCNNISKMKLDEPFLAFPFLPSPLHLQS